jgi:hypothetical protein
MMISSIAGASLQWTLGVLRLRSDSPGLPGQSGMATECYYVVPFVQLR